MEEKFELTPEQIDALARPILKMYDKIVEYYKDPENMRKYREWYFKKYNKYPPETN